MREKLETLPLAQLKTLAKAQNIKGASTMKKSELIDALCSAAENTQVDLNEKTQARESDAAADNKDSSAGAKEADTEQEQGKDDYVDKDGLDSGIAAHGILEVMADGYGFIRCENYLPGENDVYVAPSQIRRFGLRTGDIITGNTRVKTGNEKFSALLFVKTINGLPPQEAAKRYNFEDMTPVFPDERIHLESGNNNLAMRIMDLISPVGKGQRGMIVSP
ncbi:MAG: Rho termination factor N-terminal domain-containing protein, partial [Lachnospiraceae bacterium]|nr:Rho termination factor N-terminal domain-containing protein [Lachnospiraceae bacterium]